MKTYQRSHLPFKIIEGTCYIIDSFKSKSAYKLNETSADLWIFLEKKRTYSEILEYFQESYEIQDLKDLEQDMTQIISELTTQSLVHEYE